MSLAELFYYDPTSPTGLRWKVDRWRGRNPYIFIHKDDVAGSYDPLVGYHRVYALGKRRLVHRIVYELHYDLEDCDEVDHKDGNTLNNLIGNLRVVTSHGNARNRKRYDTNTSGATGVWLISSQKTPHLSYWAARWTDLDGDEHCKCFPIHKLGETEAYEAACSYRKEMIKLLNNQGAGYTERHGS